MQAYVVGGAVRDALLGLPVKDRDWVVVGSTPDEMLARGFRPVGRDFPVSTKLRCRVETPTLNARSSWLRERWCRHCLTRTPTLLLPIR